VNPQKAILHVQIVRFTQDHQPGFVACEFFDADGQCHTIIDKVPIFLDRFLDATSEYPQVGEVRCTVLDQWCDERGRDLVRINTDDPYHIESTEELSEFVVFQTQISARLS
jgi:hypothetical protein